MISQSTLALDVMQAALSLAVKRMLEGPEAVTDAKIERAAELFKVGVAGTEYVRGLGS